MLDGRRWKRCQGIERRRQTSRKERSACVAGKGRGKKGAKEPNETVNLLANDTHTHTTSRLITANDV